MATQVHLCRMLSFRIGPAFDPFVQELRGAGAEVGLAGCLGDCLNCQKRVIARLDGAPVATDTTAELVAHVRELASH